MYGNYNILFTGRQILTTSDLRLWQGETEKFLFANPKLKDALMDPRRIFNQDETAVEVRYKLNYKKNIVVHTHYNI